MLKYLTPTLVLSAKKSATVVAAEDYANVQTNNVSLTLGQDGEFVKSATVSNENEFARARAAHKKQQAAPMIPVRLTLNQDGKFVRMSRTDKAITPQTVGQNPVLRGKNTTIDALMTPVVKGSISLSTGKATEDHLSFLVLPFVTPENGWAGYVNADFRLRSVYLPCREKQPSKAYQSMMPAEAWIDVNTQTVVRLDVIDPMHTKAPIGTLLHNIPATDSDPYMVVVTCYLANGGCCFERAIR